MLQSSALLLILSGTACTMEVNGDDQVVAVEVQNLCPVQMGNIRVSDLLAGLIQGKKNYLCWMYMLISALLIIFWKSLC